MRAPLLPVLILTGLLSAPADAQTRPAAQVQACAGIAQASRRPACYDSLARNAPAGQPASARAPDFADFPPAAPRPARNAPVVLRTREEMMFRTRLREASAQAPNFAGHYVVAIWGCGSGCVMGAAVNTRNGRVTFLPATVQTPFDEEAAPGGPVEFRPDSRLLILNGIRNENDDNGTHFYRIEGNRFVHILDVSRPSAGR